MNSDELTKSLRAVYEKWDEVVLFPFIKIHEPADQFSRPYYLGISKEYDPKKKTIMIIGQETYNFEHYNDVETWPLEGIQQWSSAYFDKQIFNIQHEGFHCTHNRSSFWKFFRQLQSNNVNLVWTNVDRMNRYEEGKNKPLKLCHELELNKQYGIENKSLLEREIEIIKPDLIIFITGPYYAASMCISFGLEENFIDKYRPNKTKICSEISHAVKNKTSIYWTYHPSYLTRIHKRDECIDFIRENSGIYKQL